ncbi:hypothetical protein CDAR_556511 [Caerostris darwini]|uniref:Uncharacterized protein n=1 Tax=Caerostris darwini TaxID=1538125 RepID=A0AAV4S9S7_9ARAC|nr:hypothetical protein CDAR_556511 [Caerostris darwini]
MESFVLLWLASKHRIEKGRGEGSDYKRKEMEGDGNLRTEGWDDLPRGRSHIMLPGFRNSFSHFRMLLDQSFLFPVSSPWPEGDGLRDFCLSVDKYCHVTG